MFGMPRRLLFGYLALAVFMTGDGFELTFLSRFLVEKGFSPTQAGFAFTAYGLVVAFSAWTTGVLAEIVGAKRLMVLGGVLWMVLHVLFLTVGLQSVLGTIVIYSLRGVAYPLFMYSFVVLIAQSVQPGRLASAMGWFWSSFSLGIGVMGAYVPSLLVPAIGEYATLWASLVFVAAGTAMCAFLVPGAPPEAARTTERDGQGRARELLRGVTILVENRQIALSVVIRVLCNLTLYAFPMMMPLYLTTGDIGGQAWFSLPEWMTIWAVMNAIALGSNVVWGRLGDRYGWMRQMRWCGFGGMAIATLAFAYVPVWFGAGFLLMVAAAVLFALSVTAFVPMGAIFPALAPGHRGAAISAHNLASGLTTFAGPGIATALLPVVGPIGVCWAFAGLMVLGTITTFFIHPPQPGITTETGRMLPRRDRLAHAA
ncbi:MFS transporter [Saccharopolyspora mangrovi]|uniref:MFS transporter n=1 Tax=Saccharopolyspora mangrovi TaxID=3082379 RepID=A0ABU6AC17_9PSEU|nr:MFS transporter [Saccharopolyspora sp. S2-29]MEB3369085.1 MFS transporter [Saccharopolyspora sp. S2-29]